MIYELLWSGGAPDDTALISPVFGLMVAKPGENTVPSPTIRVWPQMHKSSSSPFILEKLFILIDSSVSLSASGGGVISNTFEFDTYGLNYAKAGTGTHLPIEVEK